MTLRRTAAVVAVMIGLASLATAQRNLSICANGRRISPIRIAPIGPDMKLLGPWKEYRPTEVVPQVPSWAVAFDCYEGDSTGMPADTIYGPSVGLGNQRYFSGDFYRDPYYANDMSLASGTGGRPAQRFQTAWFWNPALPERMMIAAFAADDFGATDAGPSWATGYGGILLDFGVTAASTDYFFSDINLQTTGDSMSLPWDGAGSVVVYLMTLDVNSAFAPASVAQPMLWGTRWSGNPSYPGTNPSRSDRYQWDDDNPVDFDHGTGLNTERYDYDMGADVPPRILGGMTALFVDNNAELIGGTIIFSGVDAGTTRPINSATFQVRTAGNPLDIVSYQTVSISSSGQFRLVAPSLAGSYTVSCIDSHFLRRSVGPIAVTGAPGVRNVGVMNMINGNIDGDDPGFIDIADFALLSSSYNAFYGDPGYYLNADLNRDDVVDIADYAILSSNYSAEGDE